MDSHHSLRGYESLEVLNMSIGKIIGVVIIFPVMSGYHDLPAMSRYLNTKHRAEVTHPARQVLEARLCPCTPGLAPNHGYNPRLEGPEPSVLSSHSLGSLWSYQFSLMTPADGRVGRFPDPPLL